MKALLLAIAAGLCWGVGELCTRAVLHGGRIGPMTAIAVRSTVALPLIWLAWFVAVHRSAPRPGPTGARCRPATSCAWCWVRA